MRTAGHQCARVAVMGCTAVRTRVARVRMQAPAGACTAAACSDLSHPACLAVTGRMQAPWILGLHPESRPTFTPCRSHSDAGSWRTVGPSMRFGCRLYSCLTGARVAVSCLGLQSACSLVCRCMWRWQVFFFFFFFNMFPMFDMQSGWRAACQSDTFRSACSVRLELCSAYRVLARCVLMT